MKVGDLVVHIGANPKQFRLRTVCSIEIMYAKSSENRLLADREVIIFECGNYDWKDQWRVFDGWEEYESRRVGKILR